MQIREAFQQVYKAESTTEFEGLGGYFELEKESNK